MASLETYTQSLEGNMKRDYKTFKITNVALYRGFLIRKHEAMGGVFYKYWQLKNNRPIYCCFSHCNWDNGFLSISDCKAYLDTIHLR